ncbi:MAG: hypothetical protein ACOX53_02630 [Limnochordia bacterium]|jgi:hypothetical protein
MCAQRIVDFNVDVISIPGSVDITVNPGIKGVRILRLGTFGVTASGHATREEEVNYIDPLTAALGGEEGQRTAMRWEDGMWKLLHPIGMEVVYEDYEEGL